MVTASLCRLSSVFLYNIHKLQSTIFSFFILLLCSRSVLSDSFWPHRLQHTRLPCPSLSPGACSNPCPLNQWCHPTILSSFTLLLLPSIFPSIRIFSNGQLFASGDQSTGASVSASVQFSSVAQSCPTLCDSMNHRMTGLPVHHQLLEFTQTHVYWISDAIQPSHSLSSPSPHAFNLSQHQGLFSMSQFFASGGQSILEWRSSSVWYCSGDPWHRAVIETCKLCGLLKWLSG